MVQNKIVKTFLFIITVSIMILGIMQNTVKAADTNGRTVKLSYYRWKANSTGGYEESNTAYAITEKGGASPHPIYQILSTDDNDNTIGIDYYCLNAGVGNTWNSANINTRVTYTKGYDLVSDKSEIQGLSDDYKTVVSSDSVYKSVMWILDNMYTSTGSMTVEELFGKMGMKYIAVDETGTKYAYVYKGTTMPYTNEKITYDHLNQYSVDGYSIMMSPELIQTVQQAAIWYFTNYKAKGNEVYNNYDEINGNVDDALEQWLLYYKGTGKPTWDENLYAGSGDTLEDNQRRQLQEQANILYNYLVDAAKEAAKNGYESSTIGDITLKFTNSSKKIESESSNYKIGPIKVTTTGNINGLNLQVKTGDNYNTVIDSSKVTMKRANGEVITSIPVNEEFYVIVPQTSVQDGVKITVSGTSTATTKTLWADATGGEQPIVEVKKVTEPVKKELQVNIDKIFDLALRKEIISVEDKNGKSIGVYGEDGITSAKREIDIVTSTIGTEGTATYKHRKDPVLVKKGNIVTYKLHIYNEGDIDGYASTIIDQLPSGLKSMLKTGDTVTSEKGATYKANYDETNNKVTLTLDGTAKIIEAYNGGNKLDEDSVDIICEVQKADINKKQYLTNIAYIGEARDSSNKVVEQDRNGTESRPDRITIPSDLNSTDPDSYKGKENNQSVTETNPYYYEGQEDDDDFEKIVIMPEKIDLALRKYISRISDNGKFENAETYNRAPDVDTSKLKAGEETTAIYNHNKQPIELEIGDYVEYTIRVYNEGNVDAYASQITDYLPEYLDFVTSTEEPISSVNSVWDWDATNRILTTRENATNATTKLNAFDKANDNGNGSGLSYVDVKIICKVNDKAIEEKKITNIAEITKHADEDNNILPNEEGIDIDSEPDNLDYPEKPEDYTGGKDNNPDDDYIPGQQDDDDFEKVIIKKKKVDLALTKFITAVSTDEKIEDGEYLTPNKNIGSKTNEYIRATVADTTGLKAGTSTNATYTPKKDIEPLVVGRNSYILYNIRVYNEGEVDVYAGEVTDYLPENLQFVEGEFNQQYGWKANGQTVKTNYLSFSNGTDKLLKAFDKENDDGKGSGLDYKDLPILCKVSDKTESRKKLINTAEITKYEDKDGEEIENDIDSEPDNKEEKNVENRDQDDDDYEEVVVEEFDLSLLKYVTKVIVTEQGKTKTTNTGNTGADSDIIPKVEVNKNRINSTVVKFEYTIKITNEGDIEGYAQEITDYVPEGLKFYSEDNKGWKDEGNNVISTELLKDKLLKPGESATVNVVLRWINGSNNLKLKTNIAEISKDYNEKGIPDRDSTPDNKKPGEDDIDDASVLLSIATGTLVNVIKYAGATAIILVILAGGVIAIKKYVL